MPRKQKRKAPGTSSAVVKKKAHVEYESKKSSGFVLSMGQGEAGQLGQGDEVMERKKPALVIGLEGMELVQVVAGGMHSLALSKTGQVYSWGCNDEGALGRHATQDDGDEFLAKEVDLPGNVCISQVSGGDSHSAALTTEGTVYAWGTYRDMSGQVGLRPDGKKSSPMEILRVSNDKVIKIASGNDHTVALTESGLVYTWGCADQGQLGRVAGWFAARGGRRGLGYVLVPKVVRLRKDQKFKDVFCGSYCTFAVCKNSPSVYVWGLNNYGQLGTGETANYYTPKKSRSLTELNTNEDRHLRIASGQHHSILLTSEGKVYSFGRADYGRLGLGENATEQHSPVQVGALKDHAVKEVACGEVVSFAVTQEGKLYSWGMGNCLQLGSGHEDDVETPIMVEGKNLNPEEQEVLNVDAGGQHTLILARKKT